MGRLRGRLRRLEAVAEDDTMLLIVPDTGEEVRVPFDASVRWMVAEWRRETGRHAEHDPLAERMAGLVARGAYEKNPHVDGRILGGGCAKPSSISRASSARSSRCSTCGA